MKKPESIETIAAIATAPGEGGISIVRLSGPESLSIADAVFRGPAPRPSSRPAFTFVAGHVVQADGEKIDEALLLVFRAPHSFTRENVVEIQGHGGLAVTRRILQRVLEAGARMAEPGEFTRRAFLNGRIDLVQAEAVLDLIRAKTDRAAVAALDQLEGGLTIRFTSIYERLLRIAANLEAMLDFPDQELPSGIIADLAGDLVAAETDIQSVLATWSEGHLLRNGARIVIAGRPNVGKSSLMNKLLGRDRAIVSEQAGTTRDTIEESLSLDGIVVTIVDTAGLRDTECAIEQEGIRRTEKHLDQADLYLYMLDASQPIAKEDVERIASLDTSRLILLANKMDLPDAHPSHPDAIPVSLKSGTYLDIIRGAILEKLSSGRIGGVQHAVISERHRETLLLAQEEVSAAKMELKEETGDMAIAAQGLRRAVSLIGTILGREYHEELLDSIFSRFCIGK